MSDSKKGDLTRIEDLGEFLHQDDPETDRALLSAPLKEDEAPPGLPDANEDSTDLAGLDDLEVESPSQDEGLESSSPIQPDDESPLEEPTFETEVTESSLDLSSAPVQEAASDSNLSGELSVADDELGASELATAENESMSPISPISEEPEFQIEETSVDNTPESDLLDTPEEAPVLLDPFAVETPIENTMVAAENEFSVEDPQPENDLPEEVNDNNSNSLSSNKSSIFAQALTPLEKPISPPPSTPREDFKDIKKFGNAVTSGAIKAGGNPPFSVMINRIRYREDAEELLKILEEVGLAEGSLRKDIEQGLKTGALLLGQLSEYSAIYLAHRIRHLDIDVRMGLGEQIHQSKYYDPEYRGLVERENLAQNKELKAKLTERPITPQEITVSTSPTIEGHEIKSYINIIRESVVMSEQEIEQRVANNKRNQDVQNSAHKKYPVEGDNNTKWSQHIDDIYEDLTQSLKIKAHQMGGNAIIGLSFGLTPLILDHRAHYRIIAFGNVVKLTAIRNNSRINNRNQDTIS